MNLGYRVSIFTLTANRFFRLCSSIDPSVSTSFYISTQISLKYLPLQEMLRANGIAPLDASKKRKLDDSAPSERDVKPKVGGNIIVVDEDDPDEVEARSLEVSLSYIFVLLCTDLLQTGETSSRTGETCKEGQEAQD